MDKESVISVLEDTKQSSNRCLEFLTEEDASYYTFKERSEALDMAIAALREQEQSKWISVEEKPMPDGNEEYEVCCDYHGEKRIEIHKGWNTHCVTHWRPLPEPPEGGAEE